MYWLSTLLLFIPSLAFSTTPPGPTAMNTIRCENEPGCNSPDHCIRVLEYDGGSGADLFNYCKEDISITQTQCEPSCTTLMIEALKTSRLSLPQAEDDSFCPLAPGQYTYQWNTESKQGQLTLSVECTLTLPRPRRTPPEESVCSISTTNNQSSPPSLLLILLAAIIYGHVRRER